MNVASVGSVKPPVAHIGIKEGFGWSLGTRGPVTLRRKGYLNEGGFASADFAALADELITATVAGNAECIGKKLRLLDGHFALCIVTPSGILAAVDRVRSIPLAYAVSAGELVIDDQVSRMRNTLGLNVEDTDPDATLAFAMSGFTIGRATLYRSIHQLLPGEFLLHTDGAKEPAVHRYALYRPWRVEPRSRGCLSRELTEVTLHILGKLIQSAAGRQIVIPLSAGFDSRLIASGLAHLGYRNVRCFSYGHKDNFEAKAAKTIAAHLGYPWSFVPFTHRFARTTFASEQHRHYHDFADNAAATPVEHDFLALFQMGRTGCFKDDSIIVNGQSGDYITGSHIPPSLAVPLSPLKRKERDEVLFHALVVKHHALWPCLMTPRNLRRLKAMLWEELDKAGAPFDDREMSFSLYEFSEFQNRQCKYVIAGQRAYEFFGYDWRLPLWDNEYLKFWEKVPLSEKVDRNLFREMLESENWGGVWRNWPAPRYLTPRWIVPVRLLTKFACAPLGRSFWHKTERRLFAYWMDIISNYGAIRYRDVLFTPQDHRNGLSWLTKSYLHHRGIAFDGSHL